MVRNPEGNAVDTETIPFGEWIVPAEAARDAAASRGRFQLELKMRPKYGVFLWWPTGDGWVHPDDRKTIDKFIPGQRVLRREQVVGFSDQKLGFVAYHYGPISFRAMPIMWLEVNSEGFHASDLVEIKSQNGKARPVIGRIEDVLWDRRVNRIRYRIKSRGMPIKRLFQASDLRPAIPLNGHLSEQQLKLAASENKL